MNFEKPSLLSNYSPAEADWGIEEPLHNRKRFDSVSTADYFQPPKIRDYTVKPPNIFHRSGSFATGSETHSAGFGPLDSHKVGRYPTYGSEHSFYDAGAGLPPKLLPTTINFHKFIAKYLAINPLRASVIEKFKYNLVLSNLLDESLILSKNEQALSNLLKARDSEDHYLPFHLRKKFCYDGIELKIVNKEYVLLLPGFLLNPVSLVYTLNLIIFLLKQINNPRSRVKRTSQIKLFEILLIISARIIKSKRAKATIEASRNLRSLDSFMISNCNINKAMITHMIALKEFDLFSSLNKTSHQASSAEYSKTLKNHLDILLTCLILNMRYSIRELLPFSNGELLEKYCSINNVQISAVFETPQPPSDEPLATEHITAKLTIFNNQRRFFVCQLLTYHDCNLQNFFILTLCDQFNIDLDSYPKSVSSSLKSTKLEGVFKVHTATLDQIFVLNEKFRTLHTRASSKDYANDDILSAQKFTKPSETPELNYAEESEPELNNLIDKLSGVVTSLKYFKKYSQSIRELDNVEEHDERLAIFKSFESELENCLRLFGTCSSDYKADFQTRFRPLSASGSSCSNSQRNSANAESSFNLKSFHTSSSFSKRNSSVSSTRESKERSDGAGVSDKRSKRMSAGLRLGLLTVLENANLSTKERPFSNGSTHGSYNQAAFEALTKKSVGNPARRISLTSVNSNISGFTDLLTTTQITTDEDDGENTQIDKPNEKETRGMSKADLKSKLEESFARIYDLESENHELKSQTTIPAQTIMNEENIDKQEEAEFSAARNPNFLKSLEQALEASPTQDSK